MVGASMEHEGGALLEGKDPSVELFVEDNSWLGSWSSFGVRVALLSGKPLIVFMRISFGLWVAVNKTLSTEAIFYSHLMLQYDGFGFSSPDCQVVVFTILSKLICLELLGLQILLAQIFSL
ncbi:hypothetical protein V6N13_072747 [Hibiscus sabdariffa]